MDTRMVDLAVDVPLLMSHPKTALLAVLQLMQGWETVIEDDITVEQFSGAMTNMVYRCGLLQKGREVQVVLMRVHASSSDLFDRQEEINTFKGVSQAGLGPRLLLLFNNGRIEEFLSQHVTLAAADIHDPAVSAAVAATLATFHTKMSKVMSATSQANDDLVQLWARLRLWLELVQQVTPLAELQQLGMVNLEQEIEQLQQQLTLRHPCWVALCHNDLQYGNIMAVVGAADPPQQDTTAGAAGADCDAITNTTTTNSHSSSLTQQLKALELSGTGDQMPAAAGLAGNSPQQQHAALRGGADGSSSLAGHVGNNMGPGSLPSDDASLSNVSVAGSAAPSISGLSMYSASGTAVGGGAAGGAASTQAAAAVANPRVASPADSASFGSLQVLGRSPHKTVQLPDGSLVLLGMRARPRGQSPEPTRGKRPDVSGCSFTGSLGGCSPRSSAAGCGGGGGSSIGAANAAAAATQGVPSSRLGVAEQHQQQLQAPSAAAVLRHASSSQGDLLLQLVPDDPEAIAAAGMLRRRRISHADSATAGQQSGSGSSSSSSSGQTSDDEGEEDSSSTITTSAADSAEAEDLLIPEHLRARQQQQQEEGGDAGSSRLAAASPSAGGVGAGGAAAGLDAERAAAVSKSARKYRAVRRARLTPAEGLEFPTLVTSDREDGSDNSSGLSDDSSDCDGGPSSSAQHSRGRSPPSSHQASAAALAAAPIGSSAAAATGAAAAYASPVAAAVTAASASGAADSSGCITFIDYEYSGFNPVAYDIANHWCEWAADYHTDEPHVLDFNRLPDRQQQLLFVESYLRALLARLGVEAPTCADAGAADGAAGAASPVAHNAISTGTSSDAASPEPPGFSSLAGFKLAGGYAGGSGQRSEPAWSTLSSRGGSVISFPETDAGWETASQSSVMTARSHLTDTTGPEAEDGCASVDAGASLMMSNSSNSTSKPRPSSSDLLDIWRWLEYVVDVSSSSGQGAGGSSRQLSVAAWRQLVGKVVAAAEAYTAASHLLWALWGVIQAKVSDVDFDFMGYGQQRWKMYLQTRPAAAAQQATAMKL